MEPMEGRFPCIPKTQQGIHHLAVPAHSGLSSAQETEMSISTEPKQAHLDRLLANSTEIDVILPHEADRKLCQIPVSELKELRAATRIVESEQCEPCRCGGSPHLRLIQGDQTLAILGLHHGLTLRWANWDHDAPLVDGMALAQLLARNGAPQLLQEMQDTAKRREAREAEFIRWSQHTPAPLKVDWEEIGEGISQRGVPIKQELERLSAALSAVSESKQVTLLLHWYGAGTSWQQFPGYQDTPYYLLLELNLAEVLKVAEQDSTQQVMEGAARFLSNPRQKLVHCPPQVAERLLNHVLTTPGCNFRNSRSLTAFQPPA